MNWTHLFKAKKGRIISQTNNQITFEVDSNLPSPKDELWIMEGHEIEKEIIEHSEVINQEKQCITSSFRKQSLGWVGTDVLYKCMIDAYADHRPLILSPDMIWLVLCQAFSHHINKNPEKYRSLLVNHSDKKDIMVQTFSDLLSEDANWTDVLNNFLTKIKEDAKSGLADSLISDFTTTGLNERIASQITVMDVVKSFYRYSAFRCVCGIPRITLEGKSDDWSNLLKKIEFFDKFDLQEWTANLKPILQEFVNASRGDVNATFWKSIVCKYNPRQLRGISCGPRSRPSKLDGWFLQLFPYNQDGEHYENAYYESTDMLSETVRVEMNFIEHDPFTGDNKKYPMELIAGFVGVEELENKALRPTIGWMVKEADSKHDKENYLRERNENGQICLTVDKIPEELKSLKHIKELMIVFTDKIEIPSWVDDLAIDNFYVRGIIEQKEEEILRKRFPNIDIN